jgi:hypothetical protein
VNLCGFTKVVEKVRVVFKDEIEKQMGRPADPHLHGGRTRNKPIRLIDQVNTPTQVHHASKHKPTPNAVIKKTKARTTQATKKDKFVKTRNQSPAGVECELFGETSGGENKALQELKAAHARDKALWVITSAKEKEDAETLLEAERKLSREANNTNASRLYQLLVIAATNAAPQGQSTLGYKPTSAESTALASLDISLTIGELIEWTPEQFESYLQRKKTHHNMDELTEKRVRRVYRLACELNGGAGV